MGVSKENRKQPIVQMGLFLDEVPSEPGWRARATSG